MPNSEEYFVEVVDSSTREVVERLGPMSESKADRVEHGLLINLNHDAFFTRTGTDAELKKEIADV